MRDVSKCELQQHPKNGGLAKIAILIRSEKKGEFNRESISEYLNTGQRHGVELKAPK